jgi:hypothetical protein
LSVHIGVVRLSIMVCVDCGMIVFALKVSSVVDDSGDLIRHAGIAEVKELSFCHCVLKH